MIDLAHARQVRKHRETLIYVATGAAVVVFGLLEGVIAGVVIGLLVATWRLTRVRVTTDEHDGKLHVMIGGLLTFLTVPSLNRALARIPAGADVDLELNVFYMDHAAAVALRDWHSDHQRTGACVDVHELHHTWYRDALHGRTLPTSPSPPAPLGLHRRKPSLQHGARSFHRHARTHVAPLLADLADTGQTPQHLFITCADSRLVPNLITATAPGELFTVRNIGNVVAPYGQDPSMQAAIDYAVGVLAVATITVCGHSHCGAVQAAASRRSAHTVALHRWLDHVRHPMRSRSADADAATLAQRNVVQQMENLCTHPAVAERVVRGDLQLVGMYFDLATSQVHFLDLEHGTFRPVDAVAD